MQKLFELSPGQALSSGIFPGLTGKAPLLWADGENVLFDSGLVRKSQGAVGLASLSPRPTGMKSASLSSERAHYVGMGGTYAKYTSGAGLVNLKTGLSAGGVWIFVPWGQHLISHNQQAADGLRYWNGAADSQITTPFTWARTIFKFRETIFAAGTSNGQNFLENSDFDDPLDWTPTLLNSAGSQELREVNGALMAGHPLGGNLIGLYSEEGLGLLSSIGGTLRFSFKPAVSGIGALSHYSIVPVGQRHYGILKEKGFVTDGVSAQFLEEPALRSWLETNVNWSRATEVYGWHDRLNSMVRWALPSGVSDFKGIGFRYSNSTWTRFNDGVVCGEESGIWPDTFLATQGRLLRQDSQDADFDDLAFFSWIQTRPLDMGQDQRYKLIDKLLVEIVKTGQVYLTIGFSDTPHGTISWNTPIEVVSGDNHLPQNEPREGVHLSIKISSTASDATWKLNGLSVHGEVTGWVN